MTLLIPDGNKLKMTEFVCDDCSEPFYVSFEPRGKMKCPYPHCKGTSFNNGDLEIYVKPTEYEKEVKVKTHKRTR